MYQWSLEEYSEIKIQSINEIYQMVESYNKFWNVPCVGGNTETRAFYRGQSDSSWNIEPSILRCNCDEREQYIKYQPQIRGKTLFEQLAYLQHYVTGTRMIDFTKDIDVALYFACAEYPEKDAAVFLYLYNPHRAE